jgi:hypothetical protein
MDWIEQLLGFSPDGGDGSTEALIVFACVVVVAAFICARIPSARAYVNNLFGVFKTRT